METYPLLDGNGQLFAFEIPNSYFRTSGSIARFLAKCPGVQVTKIRRLFEFGNEIHAEFFLDGTIFEVWEPYGDNSRFWIGPKGEHPSRVEAIDKLIRFIGDNWPGPVSKALSKARSKVISWFH